MSSDQPHSHRPPTISHRLTRQRSHGNPVTDASHLGTSPPRASSPPPRGYRSKPSFFALMRRSGGTLDSVHSAVSEDERAGDTGKERGKGRDRWSKRASRKAPPPPPRDREGSEELDWERIRTLPRVRLVPPEDEGDPVMLYPIPHPSSLMPIRARPLSPPTLLSATIAATFIDTDPDTVSSPPSPTRRASASPPSGVVLNSLAHATFLSQEHGHWIGMSDKFILPPPIFSRGPTSSGRTAATRGIIMPKTRRQFEADIGKRMSMVEQRKRDSLELERFTLLPPLEEAAHSPPNVMMPPLSERDERRVVGEDEDVPLALIRDRPRPSSPTDGRTSDANATIPSVTPFDVELPRRCTVAETPVLGPAIELKSIPIRRASYAAPITMASPPLVVHINAPSASARPAPPALKPVIEESLPPITRQKRSRSLTAVLSRSFSDDGPSSSPAPPPVPHLRRQKSLKALFFPSSETPPPVPPIHDQPAKPRNPKRASRETKDNRPATSTSKKGKHSRAKSKPSLWIEVKPQSHTDRGIASPALGTASSSGCSEAFPLTPATARSIPVRDEDPVLAKESPAPGVIRGLSKRFSLSNMSGAFRKKSSISGMIPILSHATIPVVPELPAVYRNGGCGAKSRGKGKAREEAVAVEPDANSRRRSRDSARGPVRSQGDRRPDAEAVQDEGTGEEDDKRGVAIAGPSQTPSYAGYAGDSPINLIGLSSLGTEPFDILDTDYEFPPTSNSPVPSSEDGVHGELRTDTAVCENADHPGPMAHFDRFPDPETSSLSSCSSLDDDEPPSIIHAQLMQVSPTSRRNPGVSMQESLGMVPLPQMGVFVTSPIEKRRSVEGVITGPLLGLDSPLQVLMKEVKEAKLVKDVEAADLETEHKGKKRKSQQANGSPLIIDLRGQYLKGIDPSGSRGAQHLLGKGSGGSSPTSPASIATSLVSTEPITHPPLSRAIEGVMAEKDDSHPEVSALQDKGGAPETPGYEQVAHNPFCGSLSHEITVHNPEQHSQFTSVDSGLVIVEIPQPPSPSLHPIDMSTRNPSRSSTPRPRYTTPEALLRLITSPLASSRLSRSHAAPDSNGSGKARRGATPSTMPILAELEGLPVPREEDGELNWSALSMGMQLGSLHFDDLGLDMECRGEGAAVVV